MRHRLPVVLASAVCDGEVETRRREERRRTSSNNVGKKKTFTRRSICYCFDICLYNALN